MHNYASVSAILNIKDIFRIKNKVITIILGTFRAQKRRNMHVEHLILEIVMLIYQLFVSDRSPQLKTESFQGCKL